MVIEALYAHCPRNLKVPNSRKHSPSTRLDYATWRGIYSEGILFGLAREKSAVRAFPDNAVENENRYSVLLSLDYIPSLSNFAYRITSSGKRKRKRDLDLGERAEPQKIRSSGADVLETPPGSQSAHSSCAKHEEDADHPKEQRQHGNRGKELEECHSGYSDLLTPSCLA
jgi:hypothetical protein